MPPRKRKAARRKGASRKTAPSSVMNWPIFLAGAAVGAVLSLGGMYVYTSDLEMNFGAGIKNLVKNRADKTDSEDEKKIIKSDDPKPVFDFYTVLPEYETVVDEKQFIHETQKPAKAEKPHTYILQAASYKSFKDADMLKAKLALNGLSSRIEKISVEGKGNYYRVRLGPYSSTRTKKDVVKRLGDLGIKPLHLKVEK